MIFSVSNFKFWEICLVNISVRTPKYFLLEMARKVLRRAESSQNRCPSFCYPSTPLQALHGPPKDPSILRNAMALKTEVFCYCCSVLLYPYRHSVTFPWKSQKLQRSFRCIEQDHERSHFPNFGRVLRGNTIRGNRPERFWEGNLPLRGSLGGPLRGMVSELFRAFQRFSELFRGFQRFSEVFRGFSEVFQGPLRDPLRVPFSSQSWGPCCP